MKRLKFLVTLIVIFLGFNLVALADENLQYDALAVMECSKGNITQALEYINRALEENPQEYRYYNTRGSIKEKIEDYDGAIQDYTHALYINPEYATAYFNRANLYVSLDKTNEAMSDFCMAIKYSPDYDSYNNRGLLRLNIQDYDGAIYDFTKAIAISSKPESAYFNLGLCYFQKQLFERAITDFTVAIKKNPLNPDAYYYRGISKAIIHKKTESIADLTVAKEQYLKLNNTDEYKRCVEKINTIKNMR